MKIIIIRGSLTHTLTASNNWWKVKLQRISYISHIDIYNRQDCCANRLHGARIFLDGNFIATIIYKSGVVKYSYKVDKNGNFIHDLRKTLDEKIADIKMVGNSSQWFSGVEVKLVQRNHFLQLAEVEVYGRPKLGKTLVL